MKHFRMQKFVTRLTLSVCLVSTQFYCSQKELALVGSPPNNPTMFSRTSDFIKSNPLLVGGACVTVLSIAAGGYYFRCKSKPHRTKEEVRETRRHRLEPQARSLQPVDSQRQLEFVNAVRDGRLDCLIKLGKTHVFPITNLFEMHPSSPKVTALHYCLKTCIHNRDKICSLLFTQHTTLNPFCAECLHPSSTSSPSKFITLCCNNTICKGCLTYLYQLPTNLEARVPLFISCPLCHNQSLATYPMFRDDNDEEEA